MKFSTKGVQTGDKLKGCAQELSFGEGGDRGNKFCGNTTYHKGTEVAVCLDLRHYDQWDPPGRC